MSKATLVTISDQLLQIKRQLRRLLSHAENGGDISRALSEFTDRLFTPLRKDVLKFLYQDDSPFSAKKALFDIVQKTGKEILNEYTQAQVDAVNAHAHDDPAEIDAPVEIDIQAGAENAHEHDDPEEEVDQGDELLEVVVNGLDELDDLVSNILFRDQKISLEDINQIHTQYFDSQSLRSMMTEQNPWVYMLGGLDKLSIVGERLWAQKQKLQPGQSKEHAAISVTDNQSQHESGANQDVASQQIVERQAMVKIIFRQLSCLGSRLPEITTVLLTDERAENFSPELIQRIHEAFIKSYLLQLALCSGVNDSLITIENESVVLSKGKQSLDITDVMRLINNQKREHNPILGSILALSEVQSQEVSIEKKEGYLSEYDEYIVFLSKEDRDKLSPNFVKLALQKSKTNGLLLSDTILKFGPEFINAIFAKDNGIEEVNLTPQCVEKIFMHKGLSERARAQLRLKLPAWQQLEVENVVAYLKSDYCHSEDLALTGLKKVLGKTITEVALENNQLSDSARVKHLAALFPMLTESKYTEMILPNEDWDDDVEGTEEQDADYELIGSLYLCGLAGWKPKITRTNVSNGTMTSYAIANDDQEPNSQQRKSQSERNDVSQTHAVDQLSYSKIRDQVDNNQSGDSKAEDEENKQDSDQIVDSQDRLNFLALMKEKGIKQIAKSIAENHQYARKITGNIILHPKHTGVEMPTSQSTEKRPRVRSGFDMGQNIASFLTSDDLKSLRAFQKSDLVKNNPDQDRMEENKENSEPSSGGGFRK